MLDHRFVAPRVLPVSGAVRVVNRGARYHEILAIRLERGARMRAVRRQLRRGVDPERIRRIAFTSFFLPPVAPGAVNDVPAATLRRGRYVLVCFYGDRESRNRSHVRLGMERAVRVR
jgi:hypothetical protein